MQVKNVKLNRPKVKLNMNSVSHCGHQISEDGIINRRLSIEVVEVITFSLVTDSISTATYNSSGISQVYASWYLPRSSQTNKTNRLSVGTIARTLGIQ